MSKIRVCFLGTPEFAVTCLKGILEDEHYEVVGVITQPDKPAGRKLILTPSPVKQFALSHHLKVISPDSLKTSIFLHDEIRNWGAEIAVVVAYGQILTEDFMSLFPFGCVNVHASLLPRWRGAAPIQRAIESGDLETGVALQRMVKKLDAGDILGIRKVAINKMNSKELHDQLAVLGKELLHVEMMDYIRGNLTGVPQDEAQVTLAKKIDKTESEINWNLSAVQIERKIRAFVWGPGTYTRLNDKKLKIHKALVIDTTTKSSPGEILKINSEGILVKCGEGALLIQELQPESKKPMPTSEFIKGANLKCGESFQ